MRPERFVARSSRAQWLLLAGLAVLLIAGSIALIVAADDEATTRAVGIAGLVLFGGMLAVVLRQFSRGDEVVIEIDARGLCWRRWSDETIPWAAFTRAAPRVMRRQRFLCLWLRDSAAHRSTHVLGRLARMNKALGFGDIALSAQATDQPFDALVAAVRAHAPQLFDDAP